MNGPAQENQSASAILCELANNTTAEKSPPAFATENENDRKSWKLLSDE